MNQELRDRILTLCRESRLRVRDVKVLKGKRIKTGNAMIAGVLPGTKYIFLTDYLIEHMDDDEVLAVVAHEIGHGKKHHLLIKLLVPLAAVVPMAVAITVLASANLANTTMLLVIAGAMPLVLIGALLLLNGVVGLRMEKAADDYACDTVGCEPMIGALEKLADMNMAKRDTGRMFNLLTQHPNIEDRIARLRDRLATSSA
jgi:Zn-dependent protease with chaperone function